ncbi:sulfite exporter TauE/SafE family protein [Corynebacterium uterequi]|uniref:Probable membrane transporter protein n=1 Tax=Corynebacterium uterequi TaxID=1072256 RepID=A0A0G3HJ35_9CORY|nr:sulfite exporter TauE/SafE family protein [Corynebacterium uterequi]AKK11968.1 putative permease [Corynebacterium uterequi]
MHQLLLIALAGVVAQLVDGALGVGFGATSTTMLVGLVALSPATASAVVHTAELGTSLASGASHWRFGNVDWRLALRIGLPGAIGAGVGATALSHLPAEAARPVMALIIAGIGVRLVWRYSRGERQRTLAAKPHSPWFLGGLGFFGGLIDATGGGGWGPVTTSTLLASGRTTPRRIIGTVNTAEFLVAAGATMGFVIGLWQQLASHLAAVAALLAGGVIAAPLAAWLVSRFNPIALGAVVGTALVVLNAPVALAAAGVGPGWLWAVRVAAVAIGCAATAAGLRRSGLWRSGLWRSGLWRSGGARRRRITTVDPDPVPALCARTQVE